MKRLRFLLGCLLALAAAAHALEAVSIREYAVFAESDGEFTIRSPLGAVVFGDSVLAVADDRGRKVVLTRPDGRRIVIDVRPSAICADGARLLVSEGQSVRSFDSEGREGAVVAERSHADFSRITGIAVDVRGNVYLSDDGRDVVFVISPDGVLLNVIARGADAPARLSNPSGVALDHRGSVYVLDRGNERVAVFTTGGIFRFAITGFEDPSALAVDAEGLLYVADQEACRVLRYDPSGKPLGAFGARGRQRGQFREPSGLSIGSDGFLRVVDAGNRTIHTLSWPSGVTGAPEILPLSVSWVGEVAGDLYPVGMAGPGRAALRSGNHVLVTDSALRELGRITEGVRDPVAVSADPQGRLYVVDRGLGEVKVFDRELRELFGLGRGSRVLFFRGGDGKLVKPRDVTVSGRGLVAVADVDKVEIFGPDGTWLVRAGTEGEEPGQVSSPVAVAYDPAGNLFVADEDNRRITKFDTSGAFSGNYLNDVRPLALAVDAHGRVYVLDERGPRIRVFSNDLAFLVTIGGDGRERGGLRGARGLTIVEDRLIVGRSGDIAMLDLDLPVPAPSGIRARTEVRGVAILWDTASSALSMGFRAAVSGAGIRRVQALSPGETVTGLADETEYEVTVQAINRRGHAGYASPPLLVTTPSLTLPAPGAPRVVYSGGLSRVVLQWDPATSSYASGYAVEGFKDRAWVRLAEVRAPLAELPAGPTRRYRVRALADNGRMGEPSMESTHDAAEGLDALAAGSDALAAEKLRQATQQESLNGAVWRGLGEASERLERFPEALTAYQRALALSADDTASAFGVARIALLRGDSTQAAAALSRARALGAGSADPEERYLRGQLALAEGDYDTAVRLLASAVAAVPSARNRAALALAEDRQRQFGENRPRLEIVSTQIRPIFPALYKTYATSPVGSVVVRNGGRLPLERVRLSIFIRGAMDFPSDTVLPRLSAGESILVPLHVELSNSILDVTEDDTKQAELRLTYYRSGEPVEVRSTVAFRLYARTAMTWDDPARLAAFVTGRAPVVAEFARNVAAFIADRPSPSAPLARAMALRRALALHGLQYVEDPRMPLRVVSEDATLVDHVQLPEETLRNRAGDCDDLVVLLAALLENLGVQTALADLPGHVALLVNTELPPEAAQGLAPNEALIERGGTIWVPIETTLLGADWDEAVASAASAIRAAGAAARIVEIGSAWRTYPPVTTQSSSWRAPLPDRAALLERFDADDRKVRLSRAAAIGSAYAGRADAESRNRLAVIHARLGLVAEAEQLLEGVETAAAWNNRGNLAMLRGDRAAARSCYEKALGMDPDDAGVRTNLEAAR